MCQRYIAAPLLYRGRKFDLRVLVAVRAFSPRVQALTWHETFVRAANHAYTASPDALGDFQTQFTSMRQARAPIMRFFACTRNRGLRAAEKRYDSRFWYSLHSGRF